MTRHEAYTKQGGDAKDMVAYRVWLVERWNEYGKHLNADKNAVGGYKFSEQQKREFNKFLESKGE
jgi:hypothetical protein